MVRGMTLIARALRFADVDDQVEACRRIFASNRARRVDFAIFMVEAIANDALIGEAPAIVGRLTPSAVASGANRRAPGHQIDRRITGALQSLWGMLSIVGTALGF